VPHKNIHLIFTCLVTQTRRDGSQSNSNRVDYLLQTLDSLQLLPLKSANFYISLGDDSVGRAQEIWECASNVSARSEVSAGRLESYEDWQKALTSEGVVESDLILLLTYEDHVFVDKSVSEFESVADVIANADESRGYSIISVLSHFPESHMHVDRWRLLGFDVRESGHSLVPSVTPVGCLLAKKETIWGWFRSDFTGGGRIVSTENYFGPSVTDGRCLSVVPKQELFRHLDGYQHVNLAATDTYDASKSLQDGLIGRSITYTSLRRTDQIQNWADFAAYIGTLPKKKRMAVLLRSLLFWLPTFVPGKVVLTKMHLWAMRFFPNIYFQISTSMSHGLVRYLWILTKDYSRALVRKLRQML